MLSIFTDVKIENNISKKRIFFKEKLFSIFMSHKSEEQRFQEVGLYLRTEDANENDFGRGGN